MWPVFMKTGGSTMRMSERPMWKQHMHPSVLSNFPKPIVHDNVRARHLRVFYDFGRRLRQDRDIMLRLAC